MTMSNTASHTASRSKPHILICDDDAAFSAELIEALKTRGFVATALLTLSSIRAAILAPSIILLDICMPEPNGFEIINMLSTHPRRDYFKIVLISGWDERMLHAAAKLCKAHELQLLGTFQKPVKIKPLCELLETAGVYA
jgi:PleD family two-component response regulator